MAFYINGRRVGSFDDIVMSEDSYVGIGSNLERIVFDGSANDVSILGANFGVGVSDPGYTTEIGASAGSDATFALSDGDVAHGMTTLAQTDVFAHAGPISSTVGGVRITGLTDADGQALEIRGVIGATDPTDTTPAVKMVGAKKSGTGVQDLGALETVWQVANNDDAAAITVLGSGNVGIGTTTPSTKLEILAGDSTTAQTIKINAAQASVTALDTFIDFRSTTGSEGSIAGTAVAGVLAYNTFTGSHYTQVIDKTGLEPGMVLEIVDEDTKWTPQLWEAEHTAQVDKPVLDADGSQVYDEIPVVDSDGNPVIEEVAVLDADGNPVTKDIPVLDVDGNPALDTEGNPQTTKQPKTELKPKTEKKAKTQKTDQVVPATYYTASAKSQAFKSKLCSKKGSKAAIGAWLGTDKEGRDMVASIGTGLAWVANTGKSIEIGDYLESSNTSGCMELQKDGIYANTTLAKATQSVNWNAGETRRLIRCIYLGG